MADDHSYSPSGNHSDSTMLCTGASCNSSDILTESSASLLPNWKDDGDDSICSSINNNGDDDIENDAASYEFHRIPRLLEINLLQENVDGDGDDHSHFSPSSVSFSQHSPHSLALEAAEENFPSLPHISVPPGPRLEKAYSNRAVIVDQVPTNITSTERRNSFRRRLQSAENGSIGTNPLSESKLPSPPLSPSTRSASKSRPRFVLAFGAMVLVMLSVHDNIKNSRQRYRQLYQLRREEIAFPLVQAQYSGATVDTDRRTLEEQGNTIGGHHHLRKAELPKFYFPKVDQPNTNWIRGSSSSGGRYGSHLAMARPQQPRPIFVPDVPLPDGGFQKPLERFVFDSREEREQKEFQQQIERQVLDNDSSSSWTSWMASLAVIGMLFDTGWKEYQKYRINGIPSSRDE